MRRAAWLAAGSLSILGLVIVGAIGSPWWIGAALAAPLGVLGLLELDRFGTRSDDYSSVWTGIFGGSSGGDGGGGGSDGGGGAGGG